MPKRSAGKAAEAPPNRSLRLIFDYSGRAVKLTSVEHVEMLAPPPQALVPATGNEGAWFELRNAEGRPLYRRRMHNPVEQDLEVAQEDRSVIRVPAKSPAGRFFLIVPDLGPTVRVVLQTGLPALMPKGKTGQPGPEPPLEFDLPAREASTKKTGGKRK
ncbi:MAG: hypothetical protein U0Q16_23700 [Bryobacteraceae bacterium]